MSSSCSYVIGGGNVDDMDLRYESIKCHCNIKASIKIVGPNKDSRGKLYFTCERRNCNFFAWCKPVSVSGLPMHPATVTSDDHSTIALATQIQLALSQTVATLKRIQLASMILVVIVSFAYFFK